MLILDEMRKALAVIAEIRRAADEDTVRLGETLAAAPTAFLRD